MAHSEYIKEMERKSVEGERLEAVMSGGTFDELVLKPLEQEAFKAFTKVPPEEISSVMQTQQAYKAIRNIKLRIDSIIEEGRLARENLKALPSEEDEREE